MQSETAASPGRPGEGSPSTGGKDRPGRSRGLSFEARMMLPALVILAAISILPLLYIIWMSLNNVTLLGGTPLGLG